MQQKLYNFVIVLLSSCIVLQILLQGGRERERERKRERGGGREEERSDDRMHKKLLPVQLQGVGIVDYYVTSPGVGRRIGTSCWCLIERGQGDRW